MCWDLLFRKKKPTDVEHLVTLEFKLELSSLFYLYWSKQIMSTNISNEMLLNASSESAPQPPGFLGGVSVVQKLSTLKMRGKMNVEESLWAVDRFVVMEWCHLAVGNVLPSNLFFNIFLSFLCFI